MKDKQITLKSAHVRSMDVGMKVYLNGDECWTVTKVSSDGSCDLKKWNWLQVWLYMKWFNMQVRLHECVCWLKGIEP
jgi:hypothetical protein